MKEYKFPTMKLRGLSLPMFCVLPLMLWMLSAITFWDNYIIYQTSHCDQEDKKLDCFSNSTSGPQTCEAILELKNESYMCYRLSFDFVSAAVKAGGVYAGSLVLNIILVHLFLSCARTCNNNSTRAFTAITQLFCVLVSVVVLCLYIAFQSGTPSYDYDKALQGFAIFYRTLFCCAFPWYRIKYPQESEDSRIQSKHNIQEAPTQGYQTLKEA